MAAKWSIIMPVIYQYYVSSVWSSIGNFVFFVLFSLSFSRMFVSGKNYMEGYLEL